jgi:hypothetical protein
MWIHHFTDGKPDEYATHLIWVALNRHVRRMERDRGGITFVPDGVKIEIGEFDENPDLEGPGG